MNSMMSVNDDALIIAGRALPGRLLVGTGKFPDKRLIRNVLEASAAAIVTVALRRVDAESKDENILDHIPESCIVMINTSGARTAHEAVRIARLARAMGCGEWIKIEVIADNKYLLPDTLETLKATEMLAKEGFIVLPYINPDLSVGKSLVGAGAAAVMPLGAPIGTNRGFRTKEIVRIMARELTVPVIVDAGIGLPSHASECMELGCAAVLVNTAIATAENPVVMARAFARAVEAGRLAYLAGGGLPDPSPARASSPLTGFLRTEQAAP